MPKFKITDKQTGKSLIVSSQNDSPPTHDQAEKLFAKAGLRDQKSMVPSINTPVQNAQDLKRAMAQKASTPVSEASRLIEAQDRRKREQIEFGATAGSLAVAPLTGGLPFILRLLGQTAAATGGASLVRKYLGENITSDTVKEDLFREGAYQLGGEAITGIAGKVIAPFRKTITPESQEALDVVNKHLPPAKNRFLRMLGFKQVGLLPAEFTESKTLDVMQNVTEGSLIGGNKLQAIKELDRPQIISSIMDDMVGQFKHRLNQDELSGAVADVIEGKVNMNRAVSTLLYNNVSALLEEASKRGVFSNRKIININGIQRYLSNTTRVKALRELQLGIEKTKTGESVIDTIFELPNNITYEAAKELRTSLRIMAESAEGSAAKQRAFGTLKQIENLLDSEIENSLRNKVGNIMTSSGFEINPATIWRKANEVYKGQSGKYNDEFIKSILKTPDFRPDMLVDRVFRSYETAQLTKQKVGPKTFDLMGQAWVGRQMKKSLQGGTDVISGDALYNNIFGKGSPFGAFKPKDIKSQLINIFGSKKVSLMERSIKALQIMQKRQGAGVGKVAISLSQPGALFALAVGSDKVLPTVILGGPAFLGHLLTSPVFNKWLQSTAKLPIQSSAFAANMIRLKSILDTERKSYESKKNGSVFENFTPGESRSAINPQFRKGKLNLYKPKREARNLMSSLLPSGQSTITPQSNQPNLEIFKALGR